MKVLFTNESPLIKYGLAEGFRQIGQEVKVMQGVNERLWGYPLNEQERRFRRIVNEFSPDLVFTEGHPGFDFETVFSITQSLNIPHFYWAIEDPVTTDMTLGYAPFMDYIFTTTQECVPLYQKTNRKSEVLLFGCNPEFHKYSGVRESFKHDLVLVANNYSSRYEAVKWFIIPLIESGYDLKIWGLWWDDSGRPINLLTYPGVHQGLLPYEDLAAAYSSAKIILGVNCDDSSTTQTSMRPYEALACGGGIYVAHYTKAQENIFGDYIFQVRNREETIRTVEHIINMSETERKAIAFRGEKFVQKNHNYQQRAHQILEAYQRI